MTETTHLLECFRAAINKTAAPPWPDNLEPDRFLNDAARHGILPLISPLNAPGHISEKANDLVERSEMMALRGQTALVEISDCLGEAGVPFITLKGPALALRVYPPGLTRTYGDVDILVMPRDRKGAIQALTADLFALKGSFLSRFLIRLFHFHEVLEPHRAMRLRLEVHWHVIDRANLYRIDEDGLFERASSVEHEGRDISVLSSDDEFLYLCIHTAKHGMLNRQALDRGLPPAWFCRIDSGNRLRWFADLHLYLQRFNGELDWPAMRARAVEWNIGVDVIDGLRILNSVAPSMLSEMALKHMGFPHSRTRTAIRSEPRNGLVPRGMRENKIFSFRPVRILIFLRVLFPRPALLKDYYNVAGVGTVIFRYLVHPFHIIAKQLK